MWCSCMGLIRFCGVELYKGHPIFYSLGDFVFESEYVSRLPAEAYQRVGLAPDAPIEALRASSGKHMSGLLQNRDAYRSIIAMLSIVDGRLSRVRLLPIDLNFKATDGSWGDQHWPHPRRVSESSVWSKRDQASFKR